MLLFYPFYTQILHPQLCQLITHSPDIGRIVEALIPVNVEGIAHLGYLQHNPLFRHDMESSHADTVAVFTGTQCPHIAYGNRSSGLAALL